MDLQSIKHLRSRPKYPNSSGILDVKSVKQLPQKACQPPPESVESEETQLAQPLQLSSTSSSLSENDSVDDEQEFRAHCTQMFKDHGTATTQGFFDIEKKKFQSKEKPKSKKQKK